MTDKEIEYRNLILKLYSEYVEEVKKEIIKYCFNNELTPESRTNLIEAWIAGELLFRIDFRDLRLRDTYEFELVITEDKIRREFIIVVKPFNHTLYIPKLKDRPTPKNIAECKRYINDIGEEYTFLEGEIEKLRAMEIKVGFYNSSHMQSENNNLTLYDNFIQILNLLLD